MSEDESEVEVPRAMTALTSVSVIASALLSFIPGSVIGMLFIALVTPMIVATDDMQFTIVHLWIISPISFGLLTSVVVAAHRFRKLQSRNRALVNATPSVKQLTSGVGGSIAPVAMSLRANEEESHE